MRTRDGVRLDADVYRPAAAGTYPVLLMRQPYGRKIASTLCYAHPAWYAERGYIVVVQDVRGRGTSEGVFRLFEDEGADGFDAIAWASQLEGSTGAVGMYGFSFQGTNQLLAAAERPPQLKALAPAMIGWSLHDDWAYENGAFCLQASLGWAIQLASETARLEGDAGAYADLSAAARALPLGDPIPARPEIMQRHRAYTHYFDWLDRPEGHTSWERGSPSAQARVLAEHGPPMLFVGGWYDSHLRGTLAGFRCIAELQRVPVRLMVGPWAHFPWTRRVGTLDFGPEAIGEIDQLQVRWFDRWLKGEDNGIEREPAVQFFDMGARRWLELDALPQHVVRFHLSSRGRAALDERDGVLGTELPEEHGVEHLVHDPWRPVPTFGGCYGTPPGPADRSAIDSRPDVLTFTTPPFESAQTFAGAVRVELQVEADAPSFDVGCVLSRVTADGRAYEIAAGYRRVVAVSELDAVTIPMRATCVTVQPGEALRLAVAGASFPAYPVNPGTGQDPTATPRIDAQIITLRLHHGGHEGSSVCVTSWEASESF